MKKKYAIVGTGGRSEMYFNALTSGEFDDCAELVALCDMNQGRLDFYNAKLKKPLPTYRHDQFEQMIKECEVDTVIVNSWDAPGASIAVLPKSTRSIAAFSMPPTV